MSKRIFIALLLVVAMLTTSVVAFAEPVTDGKGNVEEEKDKEEEEEEDEDEEDDEKDDEGECKHENAYYVVSPSDEECHVLYCPDCAEANPDDENAGYIGADEPHDYEKKVTDATCTKGGKTVYTCKDCGYSKTEKKTKKLLHWFGEWSPVENGKHTATCKREDCDHVSTTACETVEYNNVTICPVCGAVSEGDRMTMVEGATATASALPMGEVVVRANDSMMSVAFEYAGKMTQPTTEVTVTVPATAVEGKTLSIEAADGSETAIETTTDGDKVSFKLDFAGEKAVVISIK